MPLNTLRLASPDGDTFAEFVPELAMLCCSLTFRGEELLDTGRGVEAYGERGSTMGIPLLYPWANRLDEFGYSAAGRDVQLPDDRARIPADPNGLPIHGVVPALVRFEPDERWDDASLSASLRWATPALLELFPFEHEIRLQATVAAGSLTIATTVTATGQDRVPVSFGFHPYLRVPGTGRQRWQVELPPAEHLVLDERMIPTGQRDAAPEGEISLADSNWDDAFKPRAQPTRYAARTNERGIALELQDGFPYSQIYAPPGKDFICFEPMTAPTNALRSGDGLTVLDPGGAYGATFRVTAWSGGS